MIIVKKVDLHSLNVKALNEVIDRGYKPVAWIPFSSKMIVFLEGEIDPNIDVMEMPVVDEVLVEINKDLMLDSLPTKDTICIGTTVAGNPCKGSRFEGTEYCVAHQDQG